MDSLHDYLTLSYKCTRQSFSLRFSFAACQRWHCKFMYSKALDTDTWIETR